MGDIPDVSSYLKSVSTPRQSSPRGKGLKHTPQTIKFALELEHKRKKNEELNVMISSAVSSLTAKTKDQIKKMGKLAARLRDSKDELTALKQHLLLPRSLHQTRIVQFSLELSLCDVANPKVSEFKCEERKMNTVLTSQTPPPSRPASLVADSLLSRAPELPEAVQHALAALVVHHDQAGGW